MERQKTIEMEPSIIQFVFMALCTSAESITFCCLVQSAIDFSFHEPDMSMKAFCYVIC